MRKIMLGLCFMVCTFTCAHSETEEYEIEPDEIKIEELETRPIFIKLTVSNIQDAHSNSETTVCQKQEILKEAKHTHSWSASELALLILLLNQEEETHGWGAQW